MSVKQEKLLKYVGFALGVASMLVAAITAKNERESMKLEILKELKKEI